MKSELFPQRPVRVDNARTPKHSSRRRAGTTASRNGERSRIVPAVPTLPPWHIIEARAGYDIRHLRIVSIERYIA